METNRSGRLTVQQAERVLADTDTIGLDGPDYERWIEARRTIARERRELDEFVFFHDLDDPREPPSPKQRRTKSPDKVVARAWVSIEVAANVLGITPDALRKSIDRRARKMSDGGIEAHVDGLRARKFGRRWKVQRDGVWFDGDPR